MRVLDRLDELYAIGGGPGANRPGYSPEEDEAHRLAAGWMDAAGLEVEIEASQSTIGGLVDAIVAHSSDTQVNV